MNDKRHGDLQPQNKIQKQIDEPEWISCETFPKHVTLGVYE